MSIINVVGIDIEIAGKEINKEEFDFINFEKRYNVVFSKCDNLIQVSG